MGDELGLQEIEGQAAPILRDRGPDTAKPLRSILAGSQTLLVECAGILQRNNHEIVAVVAPPGPVADWAASAGIARFTRWDELIASAPTAVDYIFSITNLSIIPAEVLSLAQRAAINFHDGPLPDYAGLNTPVWALLAGERHHGVTWHLMTDKVDSGDILLRDIFAVDAEETALSLNTKCFEAGLRSFPQLVTGLTNGALVREPQPPKPLRWFDRSDRPAAAATIDWNCSSASIARLVSALDHGGYRNPLGIPKILIEDRLFLVHEVEELESASDLPPGTVITGGASPVVATGTRDLRLTRISDVEGRPISRLGMVPERLSSLDADRRIALGALDCAASRHEAWWRARLGARECLELSQFSVVPTTASEGHIAFDQALPAKLGGRYIVAALAAYLGRVADRNEFDVGYCDLVHLSRLEDFRPWFCEQLPLRVTLDWAASLEDLEHDISGEIAQMHRRIGFAADLVARSPELRGRTSLSHPICIQLVDRLDDAAASPDTILHIAVACADGSCRWMFDPARLDREAADDLLCGFRAMLASAAKAPAVPIGDLSLLAPDERELVLREWNATDAEPQLSTEMHRAFVEQARKTPERLAVTCRGSSLSYAELDARSNQLARHLAGLGVRREVLVGIHLDRSADMLVTLLAILKAGGAYVPLDPAYPAERLAHMIADAGLKIVVTQQSLAASLPARGARTVQIDREWSSISANPAAPFDGGARATDLAYIIYTSGSTGLPKGVMVEHRNVRNFFAGMDRKLEPEGVWLAVTSLSFDISVLELCWPLTRGYHVVIATEREVRGAIPARPQARPVGFSLFYFANSDGEANADQYRLLLEGAKFADENGFEAVWTPERHFHAFGGLYPNPSVASAAVAVTTSRVKIRAGSVVAPLHHPVRIAEEWALVDNLSGGRTGIAFASGWQPNDFLLRPENFADKNGALMRSIADVRALWRGERRSFPGPLGSDVEIGVFPRPIQPELPFWITSAGNPDTFAAAGTAGAFILTHLLGQSVDEVAAKLDVYRCAWREAGHEGEGHVTLMLHSFLGEDPHLVRSTVRAPLIEYLRTSTGLLRQFAWSFPAFRRPGGESGEQPDISTLTEAETEALLEHAFERYFETSGLFGTADDCVRLVEQLRGVGVDEIGCLIDFGIPAETVLRHLPYLDRLRRRTMPVEEAVETDLPALIALHGVTHLQCTPSLLQMLVSDVATRDALASLRRLMIGGEAFPAELAQAAVDAVGGAVMNMYGPTETTIWSAVHVLADEQGAPPLGRPLANQQIYVVDARLQPVRPGTPGELVIAGDGVVRGYLDRPELTAERFVSDPFRPGGRMYRTGDLVRQRGDGLLEFIGRLDHQVKILGHRIEPGEIEACLRNWPDVREAVVIARGDGTEVRLVAYCVGGRDLAGEAEAVREHLRASLPEYMIPAAVVVLDAMPRTPNGKLDRKHLPEPDTVFAANRILRKHSDEPTTPLQDKIRQIWCEVLGRDEVGLRDNFFDIGGHSLLAVQAHRRLCAAIGGALSLTDLFRFPTVEALSGHLSGKGTTSAARAGQDRARSRHAALQRRVISQALVRS